MSHFADRPASAGIESKAKAFVADPPRVVRSHVCSLRVTA